ncbi:MAG: DUF58 domain-containing protein [Oscillospiraceae bacterium]|nr:DUF58 domain-containing protein [Oscillospiraceae bacterium]
MPSAFIAGLFTGRREFFLLFFIMLFCALYALALNIWTAFSFSYIQELSSASSVKGSALELKIGIYNDKPFPFTLMKIITETVVPDKNYELRFNLPPQSSINFTVPVTCPYRGIYEVGMTKLEINDIFGLICTRLDMRSLSYYRKRTVKVYPRLVELEYLPSRTADAKFSGKSALRVSEDGDSYSGLRRYRPGDKLVRVHKPVSARMRELYVKSYDVPLETSVLIAVDTAADIGTGEPARYLADTACECAAAIAAVCLRSGFSVEMAGADISRPFIRGQKTNSFPAIREALAVLPFDGKGDFGAALSLAASKAGGFRAAYVISAAPPDDFSGALMRLRREGCRVLFLRTAHTKDREGGSAVPGVSCVGVTPGEDIRLLQPSAGFRF